MWRVSSVVGPIPEILGVKGSKKCRILMGPADFHGWERL